MTNRLHSLVAVAALLTLLLTGCGSTGGSDAKSATTTTSAPDLPTTSQVEATTTEAPEPSTTAAAEPTSEPATTVAASSGNICDSLKIVNQFEKQVRDATRASAPWSELQTIFVDGTDPLLAAYDSAIAVAKPDLAADMQELRDFTVPTAELAKQSSSVEELGGKLASLPGLIESSSAGQRLDAFSRSTCGFGTTEAGGPLEG